MAASPQTTRRGNNPASRLPSNATTRGPKGPRVFHSHITVRASIIEVEENEAINIPLAGYRRPDGWRPIGRGLWRRRLSSAGRPHSRRSTRAPANTCYPQFRRDDDRSTDAVACATRRQGRIGHTPSDCRSAHTDPLIVEAKKKAESTTLRLLALTRHGPEGPRRFLCFMLLMPVLQIPPLRLLA
jgi:hypothetical protein